MNPRPRESYARCERVRLRLSGFQGLSLGLASFARYAGAWGSLAC
jgi:hypothetical protein